MKILVTGANGYIGQKVVTKLLDLGNEVIAIDIENFGIDSRAIFLKKSIFDKNFFTNISREIDAIIHLAWNDGFNHNSKVHLKNLYKHFDFIKMCSDIGIKRIAVMGSVHEIGYYNGRVDENTSCNPLTFYGIAKNSLRQLFLTYCQKNNNTLYWLRGFYLIGDEERGSNVFSKIFQCYKKISIISP